MLENISMNAWMHERINIYESIDIIKIWMDALIDGWITKMEQRNEWIDMIHKQNR